MGKDQNKDGNKNNDDLRTDKTVGGDKEHPAPAPDKSQQTDPRPNADPD